MNCITAKCQLSLLTVR